MAITDDNKALREDLDSLNVAAQGLADTLRAQHQPLTEKAGYTASAVNSCETKAGSVASEADALSNELTTVRAVTADICRRIRQCYGEADKCAREADKMVQALRNGKSKDAAAALAIDKEVRGLFETEAKVAICLDKTVDGAGQLEMVEEMKGLTEGLTASLKQVSGNQITQLSNIADHIASFAAPSATPAARPGTALTPSQPQRAEDALQQLLGTALAPRGKRPTPEFATELVAALDQRVAIEGRNVRILQPGIGVTVGRSDSERPRGRQASLVRDVEAESRAFLAIVNNLPAIRRTVDTAAVADHRKRIARYVEELAATLRFPGGPLVDRASFQVEGIKMEWSALKDELGIPSVAQHNRSLVAAENEEVESVAQHNRSLAAAENEEVESEAARGDAHLARIPGALKLWTDKPGGSQGVRIARLMQQVQALEENTRQLEHAFDQAELGRSDRLSRRFTSVSGASVPLQALLDWLAEDSRGWAGDLAKGDARSSVLATIIEGAKRQHELLDELQQKVPSLVTVGQARVRRAVAEIDQNLQSIETEAGLLRQSAAGNP